MRIRKRIPPPPSDLNKSAMVQLNIKNESLPSDLPNLNHPQPSDQPPPVTGVVKPTTSRWVLFGCNSNQDNNYLKNKQEVEDDEKLWREKKESYGSRNDNDNKKELSFLSSPKLGNSLLPQLSSSSDLDGRWCEEDHKVIPLKKRSRDNYHHHDHQHQNGSNSNTMKSKTNKKCPLENGKEEQEHDHRRTNNTNIDHKVGHRVVVTNKKSKRGSVILEGSRCSRVNGRGWRCCQQTLVGYSLCEHHLGKGRLRSMNSVRNSTNKKKEEEEEKEEKPSTNDHEYCDIDDDEGDKKKKKKKKTMKKLGMVKARSLSSLLGRTDNVVTTMVADNDDNKNEQNK